MKLATIDRYHLQEKITDHHEAAVNSPIIWRLRVLQCLFVALSMPALFYVGWMPMLVSILAAILLQLVIVERVLVHIFKGWNQ
jgi:hypothetical protein